MKTFCFSILISIFFLGCKKVDTPPDNSVVGLATITTEAITSVTSTTALTGGKISAHGGTTVSARGVCWGTSKNPVITGNHTTDESETGTFTSTIIGLTPSTVYFVRAYATNNTGTAYGNEIRFETAPASANLPAITTLAPASINATTASVESNVTADGGSTVTARGVCWATSPNPIATGSHTIDESGAGEFTSEISGLVRSTTYYVRAYATNSAGTAYGNEFNFTTLEADVYVVGHEYNASYPVAKTWKNGVATSLTDGNHFAGASAIFVNGNDIYAAGFEDQRAKIWKNGARINLTSNDNAKARSVYVSGSDVYAAGYIQDVYTDNIGMHSNKFPTIWKNGVAASLPFATDYYDGDIQSIYVSGTDVYAVGSISDLFHTYAVMWKNDVATILSDKGAVFSIYVSGNDVYVAGNEQNGASPISFPVAKIWKNGAAISLTDGTASSTAYSVYVSGSDVYAVGSENTNGPITTAKVWKNGVAASLTDGSKAASAESVYVLGNDVYVAGYEFPALGLTRTAKIWKNGVETSLTNGSFDAAATSVFVK